MILMKDNKFKIFISLSDQALQEVLDVITDSDISEGRIAISTFMTPAYFDSVKMGPLGDMKEKV